MREVKSDEACRRQIVYVCVYICMYICVSICVYICMYVFMYVCMHVNVYIYEGHLESKERFAIKKYLLIIGKKKNMQVLSHTFTYFST